MNLEPGTKLGPYEITAPLGAGGMGEVYAARDARLERDLAVKILSTEMADNIERLRRFEKEARLASALNHPNIVTVYDIGASGNVRYIAMELVKGSTIRELLRGGPLSLEQTLGIAVQITGGLARAHEAGIVHRDLKPENVMVTRDGLAKVLDFGLGKYDLSHLAATSCTTMAAEGPLTVDGRILGTVDYMSRNKLSARQSISDPTNSRSVHCFAKWYRARDRFNARVPCKPSLRSSRLHPNYQKTSNSLGASVKSSTAVWKNSQLSDIPLQEFWQANSVASLRP